MKTNPFNPEELSQCVLCGMCLSACPTHRELHEEMDSPRGRISLMRLLSQGRIGLDGSFAIHIDRCLGCLACEAVCPSGVRFGHLLEDARAYLEQARSKSPAQRLLSAPRWRFHHRRMAAKRPILFRLAFHELLPHPSRLHLFAVLLRMGQRLGAPQMAVGLSRFGLLPKDVEKLFAMLPPLPDRFFLPPPGTTFPPQGDRRLRVALFLGCVMPYLFAPAHEATVRVLQRNGCEVVVPGKQICCGALHLHQGFKAEAKAMARKNIEAFEGIEADAIVLNSAGCSLALKEYPELLRDAPSFAERALSFSRKVRDFSHLLLDLPFEKPSGGMRRRATYQDPCHLAHAQRIKVEPRRLLKSIPGLEFVEMREADRCCGAAGIYNLLQPVLSQGILDFKIRRLAETQADLVVAPNPGCLLQLRYGVAKAGLKVEVLHLAELLDRAYGARL